MTGSRRKRLVIAGIVAAAVLLVVVLPGYLAMQPGFFGRYPTLKAKQGPWRTSAHAEVGCQGCHAAPSALSQAKYRAGMVGEFYLSLVSRSRTPGVFRGADE